MIFSILFPGDWDRKSARADALISRILQGESLSPGELRSWCQEVYRLPRTLKQKVWGILIESIPSTNYREIQHEYREVKRQENHLLNLRKGRNYCRRRDWR